MFIEIAEYELLSLDDVARTYADGDRQVVILSGSGEKILLEGKRRDAFRRLWLMPDYKILNRGKTVVGPSADAISSE